MEAGKHPLNDDTSEEIPSKREKFFENILDEIRKEQESKIILETLLKESRIPDVSAITETAKKPAKKERKTLSLQIKQTIIQRLDKGERAAHLAREYKLSESTVRSIKQNSEKIHNSLVRSTSVAAHLTTRSRNPLLEKVEKMLVIWLDDQNKKIGDVTYSVIRQKALKLYSQLSETETNTKNIEPFIASKGWYEKFKKRHDYNSSKHNLESGEDSLFQDEFRTILATGGYTSNQVFNVDETNLFWKQMPDKTYLSKEEKIAPGFKASKDKVTVLLCSNAEGDFKCKPFVVYHSQMPRALKNVKIDTLPVHWRSTKRGLITREIFEDWFINCFSVEVEQYCKESNIPFNVILLFDNAPGHCAHLSEMNNNVKVIFLPLNTATFIQPLEQGVIQMFKLNYIRTIFSLLLDNVNTSVQEYWRKYNILNALDNIKKAWDEINSSTLNSVWEALWSGCVREFMGFVDLSTEVTEIVRLGRCIGGLGFDTLDESDIFQMLDTNDRLTDEDLILLTYTDDTIKETVKEDDVQKVNKMTTKKLNDFFNLAEKLEKEAAHMDLDTERSLQFKRSLLSTLAPYRELYNEKMRPNN